MVSASPPRSRLRRQRGVTQTVTARAVNIAWQAGVSEVSNVPRYNIADGWRSRCAPQAIFALSTIRCGGATDTKSHFVARAWSNSPAAWHFAF